MNEAIKLAVEKGGYRFIDLPLRRVEPTTSAMVCLVWTGDQFSKDGEEKTLVHPEQIFMDKEFWRALGKALGWILDATAPKELEDKLPDSLKGGELIQMAGLTNQPLWLYHWHGFIDWIAEGKSPDSFFEELIKNYDTTKTNA